ncbi:acetyl-CoA synthetase-like protein [Myriangium duriaei CBS 260.36]|uniref:Acetyl-CoA synthetase-like protein n=1 Tax=Myriangium duriaei CBS 260.36 TaxID=1168546 RepID=A0A9P4JBB3_9PEZI|nr:acetyl-CoA synthetase-like protein [Myriangium duriaei CBS 260.36]
MSVVVERALPRLCHRLTASRLTASRVAKRRGLLTRAFSEGPTSPPLLEQTVGQHFASIVSQHGDRSAVISRHQQTTLTYHDLDARSNALARGLQDRGVRKGDRVAISLGNNVEFAAITYALFKLGAILVPLNPAFNAGQVVSALSHLDASHLIIGLETNLPFKPPRSNLPLLTHLVPDPKAGKVESELVPSLRQVITVDNSSGRIDVDSLRAFSLFDRVPSDQSSQTLPDQGLDSNDIVNIQFTSGTTSMPKAACLSHRSILNNGFSIGERMLLTQEDIVVCPPPLFHCFGCILGYMATATHGSAIVFPTEAFDPRATLLAVQENRATALYGVPTMFLAELDLLSSGAVPHKGFEYLRTGIAAGSSIPAELMRKLHRVLGLTQLTICYGMTETSPVSCMTTTDDPLQKRIDTVGRLLPHISAKVVDPADHSRVLSVGERGELAVAGYSVMKGYWNDAKKTAEAFLQDDDRVWMLTGDEASMDEEGYVTITGRIKDLIIRGGENIHPLEIESCLLSHDNVYEASVVGLPDSRYGEVVAAFIIKRSGAQLSAAEVRDHVRTNLSSHLVPKYVFWVTDYPKTASGKIQKFMLRKIGVDLVANGEGLE